MVSAFINKIKHGFSTFGHTVSHVFTGGYNEVKHVSSGIGKTITTQLNNVHDEVNHVLDTGGNIVNNVLKTGKDIINNTEDKLKSTITMPLILIAGGVGLFLVMNGKGITDIGSKAIDKY